LSEKQTKHYIHHKYSKGGVINLNIFNDKIIKKIHQVSYGMPGRINDLCEQYLKDFEKKSSFKRRKVNTI
jgi:type II secretory pathway predicted ATPase ExeA